MPAAAAVLRPRIGTFLREARAVARRPSDEDAVHDARVAGRRLAAAAELWTPTLRGWRGLRRRLRRVVRRLGVLRDLDVSLGLLRLGPAADRAERARLAGQLSALREKERARLLETLGRRLDRIAARTARLLRRATRLGAADAPVPAALGPGFERILMLASGAHGPKEAHRVRREVRRLRYAHETLEPCYDPARFRRASKALRRVQQAAGAWQDRCVLLDRLGRGFPRLRRRLAAESRRLGSAFLAAVSPLEALRDLFLEA